VAFAEAVFDDIYNLDSSTVQITLRRNYHSRILADLCDYAATADRILGGETAAGLEHLQGVRLSPGIAYAHARFSELVGHSVDVTDLNNVRLVLEQALDEPVAHQFTVSSFAPSTWWHGEFRRILVRQEEAAEVHDGEQRADNPVTLEPVSQFALPAIRQTISSVLDTLQKVCPGAHADVTQLIADLVLFRGRPVGGASAPAFFGCVLVNEPAAGTDPWIWFAEQLMHEAAHTRLFTMIVDDPLVLDDRIVASPVRTDPRPLSGVVHALYVEARLAEAFARLAEADVPAARADVAKKLAEVRDTHEQCVAVVAKNDDALTPGGKSLLNYCRTI
jgi:HEXXH motif-containing protein